MNLAILTRNGFALRTGAGALVRPGLQPKPAIPFAYEIRPVPLVRPDALEDARGCLIRSGRGGLLFPGRLPLPVTRLLISGLTKDSGGAALASCSVALYRTSDDALMERVTSGADGSYSFSAVGPAETYYVVAYKAGAPDLEGTTVRTLVGS